MKTLVNQIVLSVLFSTSLWAQSADDYFLKGEGLFNEGLYEQAIPMFTKALDIDPNHLNSYLRRGFSYSMIENYPGAIADYSRVIEAHPKHVWAYISRGSAKNKLQLFNEALTDFNAALALEPNNTEAFNNRGWAKKGLGDEAGACDDWRASRKLGNEEAKIITKNNHCK